MGKVITELSVSLDGFVAGPNDSPALPLGAVLLELEQTAFAVAPGVTHLRYRVAR
jgi:hypothetical protein